MDVWSKTELNSNIFGDMIEIMANIKEYPQDENGQKERNEKIYHQYLMRGTLFHGGPIEMWQYNSALNDFAKQGGKDPFVSPVIQFTNLAERFIGLLALASVGEAAQHLNNKQTVPYVFPSLTKEKIKEIRGRITAQIAANKWPPNSIIVYHFGDPVVSAQVTFRFLAWHHKASTYFPKLFSDGHIQAVPPQKNSKPGFYVVEIPEDDWREGIGRSTEGKSVDELHHRITDGWQFMGWEGLQLFAIFPYYPLLMDVPLLVPKIILPGLETRTRTDDNFSHVVTVDFSFRNTELWANIKQKDQPHSLFGAGLVRYLGPLEDFI